MRFFFEHSEPKIKTLKNEAQILNLNDFYFLIRFAYGLLINNPNYLP
ncbi:hypothetical protein AZO1586I_624 [Bathymodiolus thermophilus thioautotrophic gill symbiont]|uniref:Uncharacterized protein n=1 Tax=Bathymodiolus thermophilus thioautotrophic gill symbiont TaxID=2360 RepID=A0ABM8M6R7_9GAMM|nr:hypothetical protein AZO1586I_624 [Bathymodiolus thermophilus thioautotrophic gill symbiont]CAC9520296.1 hypothetical protein [uncultured Gammaproteobacteria bacterium]